MTDMTAPTPTVEDERHWIKTLVGVGPLSYLPKQGSTPGVQLGEVGSVVSIDANKAILAVGARASRGLGVLMGLLFLPGAILLAWMTYQFGWVGGRTTALYVGSCMCVLILLAIAAFISFDLNRVAEALVLLDRQSGKIIAADPSAKVKSVKDIRFLTWAWQDCDVAIERVVMSATGAQTFHLRAVQRNAQGEFDRSILLMAMIPTIQHAEVIHAFLCRYMAHDDAHLPTAVKLVPGGKLSFFEACKHSFITYLVDVDDNGLPRWPAPLIALFYGLLAMGLTVAFPFVLGKVLAEWSSKEMRFPPASVPADGAPIPRVTVIPAGQAVFAPWEKTYYLACMAVGLGLWIWGLRHYFWS